MNEAQFQALAKAGKTKEVKQEDTQTPLSPTSVTQDEVERTVRTVDEYLPLIQALRSVKRPLTSAPTNTPKTLLDMFEVYDSGGVQRFYVYVGTTWHYVVLT